MPSARFGFVRRATLRNLGRRPLELAAARRPAEPAAGRRRAALPARIQHAGRRLQGAGAGSRDAAWRCSVWPRSPPTRPSPANRCGPPPSGHRPRRPTTACCRPASSSRSAGASPSHARPRSAASAGCYFQVASLTLEGGASQRWYLVADVEQEAARGGRHRPAAAIGRRPAPSQIEQDVAAGTDRLPRIVASADGLQASADELQTVRHYANVLFNCMRGGLPADGYHLVARRPGPLPGRRQPAGRHPPPRLPREPARAGGPPAAAGAPPAPRAIPTWSGSPRSTCP